MSPKLTDKEYWTGFTGNEFGMIGDSRARLQRTLSEMTNPDERIVNLMCGKYAYVHSTLGIDIAEQMLKENTKIDDYLVWDINDSTKPYPIEDGSFDTAVMISGIAYLRHPQHTFSETRRILGPKGKFIVGYDRNQTPRGTQKWKKLNNEARLQMLQGLYSHAGFREQEAIELSISLGFEAFDIGPKIFYLVTARKL